MLDLALRLFAHLVSVSEEDLGYIQAFFEDSRVERHWFYTYDLVKSKWRGTKASLVYSAIKEYYEEFGDAPSVKSVEDIIESRDVSDRVKAPALAWLKDMDESNVYSAEFTFLLNELHKNYLKVKAAQITDELLENIDADPMEALKNVVTVINDIPMEKQAKNRLGGVMSAKDLAEKYLAASKGETEINSYIEFPYKSFNRELIGMGMGELMVLLGRYSTGKSFVLKDIAFNMIENSNEDEVVFLFDNEMSKKQLFPRLAARICGLPMNKVTQGKLTKAELRLYQEALEEVIETECYERLLFVSKTEFATVKDIKRHMIAQSKGRRPIGMFVDHIGKLRYNAGSIIDHQNVKDCVTTLGDYAQEFDCAAAVVGHLNRENTVQFQSLLDLCDLGITLHESDTRTGAKPNPNEGDWYGKPQQIDCEVTRGRSQVSGQVFYLDALFATSSITETKKSDIVHRSNKLKAMTKKKMRR